MKGYFEDETFNIKNIDKNIHDTYTDGYQVYIERRCGNKRIVVVSKLFSHSKYNDKNDWGSLNAAIEFRDKMLKKYPRYCFRGMKLDKVKKKYPELKDKL